MALDPRIPKLLESWRRRQPRPTVQELCAECPELVGEMTRYLGVLQSQGGGDETLAPSVEPADPSRPPVRGVDDLLPPDIEGYQILGKVGEGGMGVVYKAEQRRPVKRIVALKLVKAGMDTREVLSRFESERQALAVMTHPSVARVYDAGVTATGRSYFVMEFVSGEPITSFCDARRLPLRQRLELFNKVCSAIQHAHQKGIIHRDLKPSNILVQEVDRELLPKVIDFGIAKAAGMSLTGRTMVTELGRLVGTPEYVSPEQAAGTALDVDTRSDIYSLGVLLYELTTGTLPLESQTLRGGGLEQMARMIREVEPPRPSAKLGMQGAALSELARRRGVEGRALLRLVRGDLDWIILKAIEKDRARRYESASLLAMDIERHLRVEPVSAGPPGTGYRLRKWARRNRVAFGAGLAVAAALLVGLTLAVYGFVSASRARDRAEEARHAAEVARGAAEQLADRSARLSAFLQGLLVSVDPAAASKIGGGVEAVVQECRALFGDDHAVTGSILFSWASVLRSGGQLEQSERVLRQAVDLYERAHGAEHPSAAPALALLGQVQADRRSFVDAARTLRRAERLFLASAGPASAQRAEVLWNLLNMELASERGDRRGELIRLWEEATAAAELALGRDDRTALGRRALYGAWLAQRGLFDEAAPVLSDAVARGRMVFSGEGQEFLTALNALTLVRISQGDIPEARTLYGELMERLVAMVGRDSRIYLEQAARYAEWLQQTGDLKQAETTLRAVVDRGAETLEPGDRLRFKLVDGLAKVLIARGDLTAAGPVYAEALQEARRAFLPGDRQLAEYESTYREWLRRWQAPATRPSQ